MSPRSSLSRVALALLVLSPMGCGVGGGCSDGGSRDMFVISPPPAVDVEVIDASLSASHAPYVCETAVACLEGCPNDGHADVCRARCSAPLDEAALATLYGFTGCVAAHCGEVEQQWSHLLEPGDECVAIETDPADASGYGACAAPWRACVPSGIAPLPVSS